MQQASDAVRAPGELNEDSFRITQTIFRHAARISRESDIASLLLLNADLARDLTGADRCSLWLVDASGNDSETYCRTMFPMLPAWSLKGSFAPRNR